MPTTSENRMPVAVLLCAALFANFVLVPGHDLQRFLEIVTLLCVGTWLLVRAGAVPGRLFGGTGGKLLATFFVLGLFSTTQALEPRLAFFEVSIFFLLYAVAVAAGGEIARRGQAGMVVLLQIVAIAGVLFAFKFLVAYFGAISLGIPLTADDFTPGFSHTRFFNHVQTSTLPLLILLCCLTPRASRLRWLWLAVTAYWWMALYATSARGTMVGTAVACVAVAVVMRRAALPYLRQVGITAILGLAAYLVLVVALPALLGANGMSAFSHAVERTAVDPTTGRMYLWQRAVNLIVQHPLLGIGPMHYAHMRHLGAHPHDWLLQIASEWGLPALVCLLGAIWIALRALVGAARQVDANDGENKAVAAALLVGAVAILVDGTVPGILVMPQSQLGIALYLGCAFGWYRTRVPLTQAARVHAIPRLGGAVLVAVAMAGLANIVPDGLARLRDEPLSPSVELANHGTEWPRLWKAGHF